MSLPKSPTTQAQREYRQCYHLLRKEMHYHNLERVYDNPMHTSTRHVWRDARRWCVEMAYEMPAPVRIAAADAYSLSKLDSRSERNAIGAWQTHSRNMPARASRFNRDMHLVWHQGKLRRMCAQFAAFG